MRLVAGQGVSGWRVWHCEECCEITRCWMLDDETHEYDLLEIGHAYVNKIVLKAKRVEILPAVKMAFINPIPDEAITQELRVNAISAS